MHRMEEQLKQALERRDPSPDFPARVMARIAQERARREQPWWRTWFAPGWRMAMAGSLAAVLMIGAGLGYREHVRRQRALEARDQILQALQITGAQLNRVSRMVHQQ
jgi:anti-sigma factor RsiW